MGLSHLEKSSAEFVLLTCSATGDRGWEAASRLEVFKKLKYALKGLLHHDL